MEFGEELVVQATGARIPEWIRRLDPRRWHRLGRLGVVLALAVALAISIFLLP